MELRAQSSSYHYATLTYAHIQFTIIIIIVYELTNVTENLQTQEQRRGGLVCNKSRNNSLQRGFPGSTWG